MTLRNPLKLIHESLRESADPTLTTPALETCFTRIFPNVSFSIQNTLYIYITSPSGGAFQNVTRPCLKICGVMCTQNVTPTSNRSLKGTGAYSGFGSSGLTTKNKYAIHQHYSHSNVTNNNYVLQGLKHLNDDNNLISQ